MAAPTTGEVVRGIYALLRQLEHLSLSDLETINATLIHAHDHVASEMNARASRRNRGLEG